MAKSEWNVRIVKSVTSLRSGTLCASLTYTRYLAPVAQLSYLKSEVLIIRRKNKNFGECRLVCRLVCRLKEKKEEKRRNGEEEIPLLELQSAPHRYRAERAR